MSVIRDQLGKVSNKQLFIVRNLEMSVKPLYLKIDECWNKYGKLLFDIESKFLNVIGDKLGYVFAKGSLK